MITKTELKKEKTKISAIEKIEDKRNLDMAKSNNQIRRLIGENLFDGKQQKKQKR